MRTRTNAVKSNLGLAMIHDVLYRLELNEFSTRPKAKLKFARMGGEGTA